MLNSAHRFLLLLSWHITGFLTHTRYTTGATSEARTAYPSGDHVSATVHSCLGGRVYGIQNRHHHPSIKSNVVAPRHRCKIIPGIKQQSLTYT